MFTLHLGSDFDGPVYLSPDLVLHGQVYAGPRRLLLWLEGQLGLSGFPENTEYLRIELFRQALQQYITEQGAAFYAASMAADRFATAQALLAWRDELMLAGWDFQPAPDMPERLAELAAVESNFRKRIQAPDHAHHALGYADRLEQVFQALRVRQLPVASVQLYEPEELLPVHMQRLVALLREQGTPVGTAGAFPGADAGTDLGWLQQRLFHGATGKRAARGDGSLLIVRTRRDSDAAPVVAQLLAGRPDWRPVLLMPELNRTLEQSLIRQGLPPEGILSSSLARPSLQVLKLAPAFLWEPVDIFKIMEFVTLPQKPLDDGLALEIARVLAARPGLFSDSWYAALLGYLEREGVPAEVRRQYDFWFDRPRYRADSAAPKEAVIELYEYLNTWALATYRQHKSSSLLVLAEQARRISELLQTLPEPRIGFLELERIVRTIYEPSPVQITTESVGRLPYIHQTGALAAQTDALIWWNWVYDESLQAPDRWRSPERTWLLARGAAPEHPATAGARRQFRRQVAVGRTTSQLVLIAPRQVEGSELPPHLLMSDLEVAFSGLDALVVDLELEGGHDRLKRWFQLPDPVLLEPLPATGKQAHLHVDAPETIPAAEYETPTSLESLFYYPHRWFLRNKARLIPVSLYSVSGDQTLLGNLAHRFFELLLQEDFTAWDREAVYEWVAGHAPALLEREGATLLLYGREPERNIFLHRIQHAAWSLIDLLRSNGWTVSGTEVAMEGTFAGIVLKGKADLVLRRGTEQAIVDLKWSGATRRREMIRNREDLQLVLYASMLAKDGPWPYTAYFILENGRMIARNTAAFREAMEAGGESDHIAVDRETLIQMEQTFTWRMQQIQAGQIELRSARTAAELEEFYTDYHHQLLEMKTADAPWDDYRILLEFS